MISIVALYYFLLKNIQKENKKQVETIFRKVWSIENQGGIIFIHNDDNVRNLNNKNNDNNK